MFGITNFLNPKAFYLLIPIIILLMIFVFRNFVSQDVGDRQERRKFRIFIFIMRVIIFSLILVCLAKPYGEVITTTPGDPRITILVDNTSSMQVLDTSFLPKLKSDLEQEFPVTIKSIGHGEYSDIGEEVLGNLEKDTNLLIISDGQANEGSSLEDVALLAANLNSTISAINLNNKEPEVGVYITGPDTSVTGVNNTYLVRIINFDNQKVNLRVVVDNEEIFNQETNNPEFYFSKDFTEGDHRITAEVSSEKDFFKENNVFYKEVSVVKKPKILYVSNQADPVETIFNELYDVTKTSSIPDNVNDYYAVIINDMPANIQGVDKLAGYLIDKDGNYYGNGLFVIGGFDSYDRGNYKGSTLESYLPVTVGKAARKRGSSNIAISIDFSGTTGQRIIVERDPITGQVKQLKPEDSNIQDVNRALAISIIKSLGPDNKVGVSIFNTQSATVAELDTLFLIKNDLIDKVSRIAQPPGQSYFQIGLTGAYNLLKDNLGSSNIIMITDGQTGNAQIKQATLDTAKTLNSRGVKVYIVGAGRNVDEKFLKDVAYNGGGIYFPASQSNNLNILFGEPEESKEGEVFDLFILNQYHYITQGLSLDANMYGFNQVVPRTNSVSLITTQHGEPALTVWNYGLGRVASLNVFSGNNNLGDLMNSKNSILLTRITNWAIGDPQRKEPYYVIVPNARINQRADVIVKSDKFPTTSEISLTKSGENQYSGTVLNKETGFYKVLGREYSVNYPTEYQNLGMSSTIDTSISISNGRLFYPKDKDEIVKFVKSVSKRTKTEKTTIVWPFALAAAILFLIEIIIRKAREYRINN